MYKNSLNQRNSSNDTEDRGL